MNYEPLRLSGSPAKSTRIVEGPSSPTKSVSLDMDETSPVETDFLAGTGSARRTNFFDDSSIDELEKRESLSLSLNDPRKTTPTKTSRKNSFIRKEVDYLGTRSDEYNYACGSDERKKTDTGGSSTPTTKVISNLNRSSGISSIHAPSAGASKENLIDKHAQQPSRPETGMEIRAGSAGCDNNNFRISGAFEDDPSTELQTLDSKTDDRILGVHAITLQALLRDEEALNASASASTRGKSVSSDLAGLKTDPALTTPRTDSAMLPAGASQQDSSPPQEKKKVLLVPPPIDTTGQPRTRHLKPKTPYPFYHRKGNALFRPSPLSAEPDDQFSSADSPSRQVVLEIRLRRREGVYAPRVSRITIPSVAQLAQNNEDQENEKHASSTTPSSSSSSFAGRMKTTTSSSPNHPFTTDASLADALRTEYAHLAGPWAIRVFSARTLRRMDVLAPASAGAAAGGAGHIRLAGTELLRLVRRPKSGKRESYWANWCVRVAERVRSAASGLAGRSMSSMRVRDAAADNGFSANSLYDQRRWSTGTPRTPTPGGGFPVRVEGIGTRRTPPSRASSGVFAGGSSATWDPADHQMDSTRVRAPSHSAGYRYSFLSPLSSTAVDGAASAAERGGGLASPASPPPDDTASDNQVTALTIEFVESWSGLRIATALLLVLVLALAGIALWTVLGKGVMAAGWQGQGARVGTGVLVGGVVLMVGWTLVGAWIGASWCVV
ncbi:hypothetical protein BKA81DRAFT_406398 [Phyllosticta paracitricarpa]|uniref:Uncharacterized protein n=2 Tax=Phyllosticta TaxID=121621 RepID=A0ABR1MKS0_9PEZI